MTKRPTKAKKLEDAFPPSAMTAEEDKERRDQRLVRLGLFLLTYHLQKFVENRGLQALLKGHELVVSWDEEKKKVAVMTSPRRAATLGKG